MKIFYDFSALEKLKKEKVVCAIGNFDGIHKAHSKIIKYTVNLAKQKKCKSLIITFINHPAQSQRKPRLTSVNHKLFLLNNLKVDFVLQLDLMNTFMNIRAEDFLIKYLFKKINLDTINVGYNFKFGKDRIGDVKLIKKFAKRKNIDLFIFNPYKYLNKPISSTRIRKLIKEGKLYLAYKLLGYRYTVFADVIKGVGRGRTLGYPTANLNVHSEVLPPLGVYIVKVKVSSSVKSEIYDFENKEYMGVMNLGYNPTFGEQANICAEVHILGLKRELYGHILAVTFIKKIRNEKKFKSKEELKKQISEDIRKGRLMSPMNDERIKKW